MSNNIYDILNKINKLEGRVQTLKESKSMDKKKEDKKDESKKKDKADKGAIAEAVARVEKQLSEKYHGFKKMQESEVEESGLQAYLGKKKYGETGMKALQKAGRDGASKEKMAKLRAKHDKMDEGEYNEDALSPKQKEFAKLAPPPNKITYADKIAGAKKGKKDEGNEFSGELVKARAQGKDSFEVDGKTYQVKEGFPSKEEAEKRMKEKEGKTAHGKKTATKTGVKHERDYDKHDSEKNTGDEKKGRGRPKKDKFAK
jgi:hypothetical protein